MLVHVFFCRQIGNYFQPRRVFSTVFAVINPVKRWFLSEYSHARCARLIIKTMKVIVFDLKWFWPFRHLFLFISFSWLSNHLFIYFFVWMQYVRITYRGSVHPNSLSFFFCLFKTFNPKFCVRSVCVCAAPNSGKYSSDWEKE